MKWNFYVTSWTGLVTCNYYARITNSFKMAFLKSDITRGNFGERVTLACAGCTDLQHAEHGYTKM